MACPSGKIYNKKTGRCIADTQANRKRLGLKPSKKPSKKAKKPTKKAKKAMKTKNASCKCYYSSNMPSPKGFGYCAHCGKLGDRRRGTDGRMWTIKQRATGALYWSR